MDTAPLQDTYVRQAMIYVHNKAITYVMDDFGNAYELHGDTLWQWADRVVDAVVLPKYTYMN